MVVTDDEKRILVSQAISESTPAIPGMNVTVTAAWTATFKKLLNVIWTCLTIGYTIYPPINSSFTLEQFCCRVILALIDNILNPLAFMHKHTINADGNVMILDGMLDHPFILSTVIYIVWCSDLGLAKFIDDPQQQLDYAIAVVGAITKLVLRKQLPHPPVILLLTQLDRKGILMLSFIILTWGILDVANVRLWRQLDERPVLEATQCKHTQTRPQTYMVENIPSTCTTTKSPDMPKEKLLPQNSRTFSGPGIDNSPVKPSAPTKPIGNVIFCPLTTRIADFPAPDDSVVEPELSMQLIRCSGGSVWTALHA
ncbi:hypothetical protein F4604DRAFT_1691464 [Suillus subluteus]|nr:hypothetical protein F4604DRAFT_1691464 [Suillus subluteus]